MQIHIEDEDSLEEINEHFNLCFPFLKLEFFSGPHHIHKGNDMSRALDQKCRVGEIRKNHYPTLMELNSHIKAWELESRFRREFGLQVQIFWKDGNEWKQTIELDDLSLKELNSKGEQSTMSK